MNDLLLPLYFILIKYKNIFMIAGGIKTPWLLSLRLRLLQPCEDFRRKHNIESTNNMGIER